jgi:hypothetical protein
LPISLEATIAPRDEIATSKIYSLLIAGAFPLITLQPSNSSRFPVAAGHHNAVMLLEMRTNPRECARRNKGRSFDLIHRNLGLERKEERDPATPQSAIKPN